MPTLEKEIGGKTIQIPVEVFPGKDKNCYTAHLWCGRCEDCFAIMLPKGARIPKYLCPKCDTAQTLGPLNW